mgnify:FL=1
MTLDTASAPAEPVALRVRVQPWMAVAVIVATFAMAVVGYGLAKGLPPSHVASVELLVLPNERGAVDEALVRTFESILGADAFAAEIKESAASGEIADLTAAEVAASITTTRSPTSSVIKVVVTRPDESSALAVARMISPTVDELLTVEGISASAFYRQVFPEPLVQERAAVSAFLAAAIGGFLGFVLGVLGVLVWSLQRPVVTSLEDIQELAGYPVIARLPSEANWWRRRQPNILDPLAAAVAQVRETGVTSEGGVVAVVSPEADTGATFAVEFATLLAQGSDRPVFLVDGNYRTAELTGRMGADDVEGWDRLVLSNGATTNGLSAEILGAFPPIPSEAAGTAAGPQPVLVPVSRLGAEQDRSTVAQLSDVLDALAAAGTVVVACPPVPGDVPAAPAITAASAVLIVARTGITSTDDMGLVGEMVASLSEAPAGVVVVGGGS